MSLLPETAAPKSPRCPNEKNSETVSVSSDPVAVPSDSLPVVTSKEKKTAKNQLKSQLLADLDLLFSEKTEEQMTLDENARCTRLLNFIQEMKNILN